MDAGVPLVDIASRPPSWRRWPETAMVLKALMEEGGHARFVGGCVRDALIGIDSEDIDIATDLLPGAVLQGLERAGITAIPTGLDHGTVTAVCGHRRFEITSLRVDVISHGRHAEVAFTHDWELDAARRDFTFNALYLDPNGELVDPVGGLADLARRHVRFIGQAEDRLREDRLRVLRYFRFYARFGDDNPDEEALAACVRWADRLDTLSVERVQKEMLLLLGTENPVPALRLMAETGVLAAITGENTDIERLQRMLSLRRSSDALLRFAALLGGEAGAMRRLAGKWRFSNKQKERLACMTGGEVTAGLDANASRALLYRLGTEAVVDQAMLLASCAGRLDEYQTCFDAAEGWVKPQFPLSGHDLRAHGMSEGAEIGRQLREMEERWIASGFTLSRTELLTSLRRDT
ncbi:CCA tRNA nucleotidyltransferase [Sneathiella sp.]|uniref:CCA tRNA nucleotidyltransferase n=1 Tax=Sneathiella sp. TaxID=1964365 RepID=UPI0025ED2718|nr:CCA tRNA nucleotidyltransferase [Sneathiella sp.]